MTFAQGWKWSNYAYFKSTDEKQKKLKKTWHRIIAKVRGESWVTDAAQMQQKVTEGTVIKSYKETIVTKRGQHATKQREYDWYSCTL